ncbi:MAG TPA: AAA family ATPase [Actinomycetota bacterium]|nr:AAA family ATPase [Actinomycetota bacterium]
MLCPSCGEPNPDRARFCLRCGSPMAPVGRDEERRQITVLFCDLVGFTARSDHADPEDVKATLRPYHAAMKRTVEGFGGTLDRFVGDGVLAVFGAPVAHEDDPERAIRVAFKIQREIDALNERMAGPPLAVRVGIDTGEAVVALARGPQVGDRVTGDVVATAGRLQAVAPIGGIAVGAATVRATKDHFDFQPIPGTEGAPGGEAWRPVEVSRLVRERPETPFVGREVESAMLRTAFRRSVSEHSVQLVTIAGEPGVGKSRLIEEFAEYLDEQPELIRWRQGRCLPYGEAIAFWPLSEIVKVEAGILDTDPPQATRAKLARSVETVIDGPSERDWLLARLAPLAGLGELTATPDRTETFTAWRRYLEGLARLHPLVVVLEDLHWADDALLDFVEHLVDRAERLPILLICSTRPSLYDRRPGWMSGKRNATSSWLPPLSETETAMLISGLLDRAVLPATTQSALLERAGGNPLYAEEFVRMLSDTGVLEPGRTATLPQGTPIPIPGTVQAIIGARLDTLPPETKTLLQDASVLGRVFWTGAVARMSGQDPDDVRRQLRDVARLQLIRPIRSSSVRDDEEYAFWHLLVRDVAYAHIPRAIRGGRHRAAAEWIEEVAGDRLADRAEVVAHHYEQALELTAERDLALVQRTVRALARAGAHAFRLDAATAEGYVRRAVDLLPEDDPERPRLRVRLAEIETSLARFADARHDYDLAIAQMLAFDDMVGVGEALALKTRALHRLGALREAEALLREAISILEAEPPGPELARVYARMAGNALTLGRFDECRDYAERGLRLAERLQMDEEAVRSRQFLGAARCELGDAGGLADLWAALREALELGIGIETAVAYGNLATQLWVLDGPAIALQVWDAAVEFSQVRGFRTEEMWSRCGHLEVLFDLGRWDEVEAIGAQLSAEDTEEGGGQIRAFADIYRASVLARRGRLTEAVLLEEEYLPRVRILQRAEVFGPALTAAATLELLRGHERTALDLIEEFRTATAEHDVYRLLFLPDAVRVLAALGEVERASSLVLDDSRALNVRHRNAIAAARAAIAEGSGRTAEAAEAYAACAAGWLRYGSLHERAHALLGRGRCLHALGDPGAEEVLAAARGDFEQLGAAPFLREVDALLGRAEVATS